MRKIHIDKKLIEDAVSRYKSKKSIADCLGVSIITLNRICAEYGISEMLPHRGDAIRGVERPKEHPEIDAMWLIDNWVNTPKSVPQLAREYGIAESLLEYRCKMYNIRKTYKYPVVDKFFDVSDPHIWYVAGLVATDGYLLKNKNSIEITLVGDSELQLLSEIRDYYEPHFPIQTRGDRHTLRIATDYLNEMFEDVFNIHSGAKTFDVGVPQSFPNDDCAVAYVRGCIDGDGYISKDGTVVKLTSGSFDLVGGLANIISRHCGFDVVVFMEQHRGVRYPSFSISRKRARVFLKWIYSIHSCFMLKRKYLRYLQNKVDDIV